MILLRAKNVDFDVTYVDLRNKPDWFLEISPHGKVPVLKVDDEVLFESNAIAEFLDEMVPPTLHPGDPVKRARNRAWTDFVPDFSAAMNKIIYGASKDDVDAALELARQRLQRLEKALAEERDNDGPYFNGISLCLVDAAYAPFLQRFRIVDGYLKTGLLEGFPLVSAWADALLANETISGAVPPEFERENRANHARRQTYAGSLMATEGA